MADTFEQGDASWHPGYGWVVPNLPPRPPITGAVGPGPLEAAIQAQRFQRMMAMGGHPQVTPGNWSDDWARRNIANYLASLDQPAAGPSNLTNDVVQSTAQALAPEPPRSEGRKAPTKAVPKPGSLEEAIAKGDTKRQAELSSTMRDAQYAGQVLRGLPPGAVTDARSPQGFTFANPADLARYTDFSGNLARNAAADKFMSDLRTQHLNEAVKLIASVKGLDPALESALLNKLGFSGMPNVASKSDQTLRNTLAGIQFKHQLDMPDKEANLALRQQDLQSRMENRDFMAELARSSAIDKHQSLLKYIDAALAQERLQPNPIVRQSLEQLRAGLLQSANAMFGGGAAPPAAPSKGGRNRYSGMSDEQLRRELGR